MRFASAHNSHQMPPFVSISLLLLSLLSYSFASPAPPSPSCSPTCRPIILIPGLAASVFTATLNNDVRRLWILYHSLDVVSLPVNSFVMRCSVSLTFDPGTANRVPPQLVFHIVAESRRNDVVPLVLAAAAVRQCHSRCHFLCMHDLRSPARARLTSCLGVRASDFVPRRACV